MKRFSKECAWSATKIVTNVQYGYARSVGGGVAVKAYL